MLVAYADAPPQAVELGLLLKKTTESLETVHCLFELLGKTGIDAPQLLPVPNFAPNKGMNPQCQIAVAVGVCEPG